jgi:glucose-6-phosphate 1-dehydrogenase
MASTAPPCAIVIFGASGDLAGRKLIPALYELHRQNLLDEHSYIVGYSRTEMSDAQFRRRAHEALRQHARTQPIDESAWRSLEDRFYYTRADYGSRQDHTRVAQTLQRLDDKHGNVEHHRLFYVATPPEAFEPIIGRLRERRLIDPCDITPHRWERIIIEKPFGHDLESARQLNRQLLDSFCEEQVFRIDHFLGKETVQNLMVMRFANSIFEPIWNYKYIDHVKITVAEQIGVGARGGYYDRSGALRDIVQNHMLQLMALVAMEPPVALDAQPVRDEKVKVFRSVRPLRSGDVDHLAVRGQYAAGSHNGQSTAGYVYEKDVPRDSRTETFVALKLLIDNWRWSGTPFYLRTGKFLPEKLSEVAVRFRAPPLTLFQKQCESPVYPNDLVIRVQPDEGISLRLNGKIPGGQLNIKSVALDFYYKTTFHAEPPEAYERLIYDAMTGDPTLFIRADEAEAAWEIVDPVLRAWGQSPHAPAAYLPGTWGPNAAAELIEQDGRRWLRSARSPDEPIIACSV